jgi:hypothetical protein
VENEFEKRRKDQAQTIGQTLKPKTRKLGNLNGVVKKKKRPRTEDEERRTVDEETRHP